MFKLGLLNTLARTGPGWIGCHILEYVEIYPKCTDAEGHTLKIKGEAFYFELKQILCTKVQNT